MMGLATAHLAEVLDDDRRRNASARADIRRIGRETAAPARERHERQRALVSLSLLLLDRGPRR
jgi:hypothetical protein